MNRSQVVKVLVGARERRRRPLEDAWRHATSLERQARAEVHAAQTALASALSAESEERGKLRAMCEAGQALDIDRMTLRGHVVAARCEAVSRQREETGRREDDLAQRSRDRVARHADRLRNDRKIEALQEKLQTLQAEDERASDDAQDEEAEEAAIARHFAGAAQAARR